MSLVKSQSWLTGALLPMVVNSCLLKWTCAFGNLLFTLSILLLPKEGLEWWMDQENRSIHRMEYYSIIERNKVQAVSDFWWFDLWFFNFTGGARAICIKQKLLLWIWAFPGLVMCGVIPCHAAGQWQQPQLSISHTTILHPERYSFSHSVQYSINYMIYSTLYKIGFVLNDFAQNCRGTKEPLAEGERREWKSWFKTQHKKKQDHGIWSHHFMANRKGKSRSSDRFYFLGLPPKSLWMVTAVMKLKDACSLEGKLWQT